MGWKCAVGGRTPGNSPSVFYSAYHFDLSTEFKEVSYFALLRFALLGWKQLDFGSSHLMSIVYLTSNSRSEGGTCV